VFATQRLGRDGRERVGPLDDIHVIDVFAFGHRPVVDDAVGACGARVEPVDVDGGGGRDGAGASILELCPRLSGGRDDDHLAAAFGELAAPRTHQAQVTVTVALVEERERRDDAIAGTVIGSEDL
jgi:hypothetical protein